MTDDLKKLWAKINDFELDSHDSSFTFTDRIARENGWTIEYSIRSINEYKKFIFLMCISNHPLTPSDQVDQVWHLHLLYTKSYWEDFCKATLGKQIHHGPTKGGQQEKDKYSNWYEKTIELYTSVFNKTPPQDIWPKSEVRFKEINFIRVNANRNWIIKKPLRFK